MTELGRAGFKPDQIVEMTGAVMDMARATGTDATVASGIMAATIRQFGLEATDATRVADGFAAAANKTFIEASNTITLKSKPDGAAQILWREPGLGRRWAVVRLSKHHRTHYLVRLTIAGMDPS